MITVEVSRFDWGCIMCPRINDYGGWVLGKLEDTNITVADLSRETGILYPSLDRILKSSQKGKFVRSDKGTIEKINKALVRLDVIEDENEAWVAAGFNVEGYEIVKEGQSAYSAPFAREIALESLSVAERYDGLPPAARDMVRGSLDAAERMVQEMMREGAIGRTIEDV